MSRKGTPQDNAFAESFMKTLKYEEVYMTEYANLAEARDQIGYFLEEVYNKKRFTRRWATARQPSSRPPSNTREPHLNHLCQNRGSLQDIRSTSGV